MKEETYEEVLDNVRTASKPSELKITDMRVADIIGAPMPCCILKLYTNQGIVGYGEVRDFASRNYALSLKSRIVGENPCNIDKIFRRIKQFGGQARQAGGVCGIELALWDLAGKAYEIPVYQMLGGRFRDKVRVYADTDVAGKHTGKDMGKALKKRMDLGFTFLKMDVGIELLFDEPGAVCAPTGVVEELKKAGADYDSKRRNISPEEWTRRNHAYDTMNVPHPFTGLQITEHGLDILENYVKDVRETIGYEVPLAIDHFGHFQLESCIRFAKRMEKYSIAWLEDLVPWQYTDQYMRLSAATSVPVATGEDIYLKENFKPLLEHRAVSVIHPDILSAGGILELKKISDLAEEHGVAMAIHMAETPVAAMAAAQVATASENFLAQEFHSVDVPWWNDMVKKGIKTPLIDHGFIHVEDAPGLGIEELDDEVLKEHVHPDYPELWADTSIWDHEYSHDRLWS